MDEDVKHRFKYKRAELKRIYKKVDINKFFSHYRAKTTGQTGDEIRMHCILPAHKDTSPSANFNIKKGLYNCYVCGGRSFFQLVQELENLQFGEAVEFVRKMVGLDEDDEYDQIDLLLEDLKDLQAEEDEDDEKPSYLEIDFSVRPEFESALNHFLKVKRRVSIAMIKLWDLRYVVDGYYKDRLVIPITHDRKVVSFAARDMTGKSELWLKMLTQAKKDRLTITELAELRDRYECKKIIYPPILDKFEESRSNIIYGSSIKYLMFNIDRALANRDYVILVEGAFDAMRLHMWGFNAVAILGTKLSSHNRTTLLSNFDRVYIALDNDIKENNSNPGQEAAVKIIDSLKNDVEAFNVILPPGKDPDECTREEFSQLLGQAAIAA
jgi:hypothetical protein